MAEHLAARLALEAFKARIERRMSECFALGFIAGFLGALLLVSCVAVRVMR